LKIENIHYKKNIRQQMAQFGQTNYDEEVQELWLEFCLIKRSKKDFLTKL
jgi:hypothetical protein